jgi:hypothetical protein
MLLVNRSCTGYMSPNRNSRFDLHSNKFFYLARVCKHLVIYYISQVTHLLRAFNLSLTTFSKCTRTVGTNSAFSAVLLTRLRDVCVVNTGFWIHKLPMLVTDLREKLLTCILARMLCWASPVVYKPKLFSYCFPRFATIKDNRVGSILSTYGTVESSTIKLVVIGSTLLLAVSKHV